MRFQGPLEAWDAAGTERAVTIGVFDGVHRGHRFIFRQLDSAAAGRRTAVVTFDRHPRSVVTPDDVPPLINSNPVRLALLEDEEIDDVAVLTFDESTRQLTAAEFSKRVLKGALRASLVVVGTGFRFGRGGEGDIDALNALGKEHGYTVQAAELLAEEGIPISSSHIRQLIRVGQVEQAEELLGRRFTQSGVVVAGDRRGAAIGFPTANLEISPELLIPGNGVYVGYATLDGETWEAVVNVGVRPTFAGDQLTVEAHLLDFEGDLYGLEMRLEFRRRLRSEVKFEGVDELVQQIHRDIDQARGYFTAGGRALS